jgi:hypothetical protein
VGLLLFVGYIVFRKIRKEDIAFLKKAEQAEEA